MEGSINAKDMREGDVILRFKDNTPCVVLAIKVGKDDIGAYVQARLKHGDDWTEFWWTYDRDKCFTLVSRA